MDLVFCCEAVFQFSKGMYYSHSSSFGMKLWSRYLNEFENIVIVARVEEVEHPDGEVLDDPHISFIVLPRYKGLKETILSASKVKRLLQPAVISGRAYILRVPGQIGNTLSSLLHKRKIPYAIEVVGDPWDVMANIGGKIAFILKRIGYWQLKRVAYRSSCALYVTKRRLQHRYPVHKGVTCYGASDVILPSSIFTNSVKIYPKNRKWRFIAVGSLEQLYKAPDIVIKALKRLKEQSFEIEMFWLGDGWYKEQMQKLASDQGVEDVITFCGNVDSYTVNKYLENSDLFIHVSRTEGLPRAIIEAMSKGLPVIGSNVGGIPELLCDEVIVQANDVDGLVNKIKQFINNPDFYNAQSERNLLESRQYEDSILSNIRSEFYNHVKSISAK